jgi:hypothetical protein
LSLSQEQRGAMAFPRMRMGAWNRTGRTNLALHKATAKGACAGKAQVGCVK